MYTFIHILIHILFMQESLIVQTKNSGQLETRQSLSFLEALLAINSFPGASYT